MVPAITLKGRTRPQAGAETRLRMLHFFLKTVGVLRDPILVADWRVQEVAGCLLWPHPYPLVALGTHTLGGGGWFPWQGEASRRVVRALGVQPAGPYPELPTASQTSCFLISANGGDQTHLPHRC